MAWGDGGARAHKAWLAAAGAALSIALPGSAHSAPADTPRRPAHGLIVQLKQAPSHESLQRAHTLSAEGSPAEAERQRVRQVLAHAGLADARLRPVGRAAQLIHFDRVLGAAEAQALAERLRKRPEVDWVVPNERERRLQTVPNDPMFGATASSTGQWWLHPVAGSNANAIRDRLRGVAGVQSAWITTRGSASAVVAVLDTGITNHPDLAGHVLPGYDFVSTVEFANDGDGRDADASDPGDWVTQSEKDTNPGLYGSCEVDNSSWHGTDIAGILAAVTNNGSGVAAINWNARVLPVRVAGKCGADVADIVDGMRWSAGLVVANVPPNPNPARVVNISFGGSSACNAAYQGAIDELAAIGVVVVAAVGNEHGSVTRPGNCSNVVAVAALNRDGFKATYSNFGPHVSIATVGGDTRSEGAWGALLGDDGLLTLDNHGLQGPGSAGYSRIFGSSFAAPVVAGTIGLMLSANPALTHTQIRTGLGQTARPHVTSPKIGACSAQNPGRCICSTATCGAGILDAEQALLYALNPASYVAPARQPAVIDNAEVDAAVALGNDLLPDVATPAPSGGGGGALGLGGLIGLVLAVAGLRAAARFKASSTG